jgi:hypothetical protein
MAAPIVMYGSETWVHSQKEMNRIQTAEMKFLRKVKRCSRLDRTSNEDIRVELRGLQIIETDGKTTSTEWKTINCRSKLGNTSQREKEIQF